MPVILQPDAVDRWLDPACPDPGGAPDAASRVVARVYPVSERVNSPRNDDPALLDRVDPPTA